MALDFTPLTKSPRLLFQSTLLPLQGSRFQPTGFPDLGAATYRMPDDRQALLLESAQSVANRLETVCWDAERGALAAPLAGLSYVAVMKDGKDYTNSLREAHRLNSPYILESQDDSFFKTLQGELSALETGPVDWKLFAKVLLRYDINSLLHGVFLAKEKLAGGRLRMSRALSGFIEAVDVQVAASGGVKNDHVDPSGDTAKGFGNVPFHRDEYVAKEIVAYFNLDLQQIRNYGLGEDVEALLIALAMWKVQRFLENGLRLRTACDLRSLGVRATMSEGFELPSLKALEQELPRLIATVAKAGHFAKPAVTEVKFVGSSKKEARAPKGDKK